jgi:hypothetical protein
VLTRGQPVEITVLNKLPEPTSVHWHGIELESYYDGIAGWSGTPGHIAPMIEPGASFVARFTPPRAGTFIYHTHLDDIRQLSSGLYRPLIVLEPGQSFDPARDRVMLISVKGPSDNTPILFNGDTNPGPIELKQGARYRFRFINITPHDPLLTISVLAGSSPSRGARLQRIELICPFPRQLSVRRGRPYQWGRLTISNSNHDPQLNSASKYFARRALRAFSRKLWFLSMFSRFVPFPECYPLRLGLGGFGR